MLSILFLATHMLWLHISMLSDLHISFILLLKSRLLVLLKLVHPSIQSCPMLVLSTLLIEGCVKTVQFHFELFVRKTCSCNEMSRFHGYFLIFSQKRQFYEKISFPLFASFFLSLTYISTHYWIASIIPPFQASTSALPRSCKESMGNYLEKPNKQKNTEFIKGTDLSVVICSMQGWRTTMEVFPLSFPHSPKRIHLFPFLGRSLDWDPPRRQSQHQLLWSLRRSRRILHSLLHVRFSIPMIMSTALRIWWASWRPKRTTTEERYLAPLFRHL